MRASMKAELAAITEPVLEMVAGIRKELKELALQRSAEVVDLKKRA
jgi:hypothetical protein